MRKFYKILLVSLIVTSFSLTVSAQQQYWSSRSDKSGITTDKAVARIAYPKEFKLFDLNLQPLRQALFAVTGVQAQRHSTIITLPNADGNLEQFEVFEASNFDPVLQARFPEIRAFSGQGITDRYATLKLSISPQGIQTMVFRTDKENEFIEAYSQDHQTYSVFRSARQAGQLNWNCTTEEQSLVDGINAQVTGRIQSNAGELRTMRLAQSCNGEYSNFFGAFNASQVNLVLAAFNATLSRCNGVYEKDLALHLNLIPQTVDVIFYDPATDPYTTLSQWNNQLQATLTAIIGEANYDIGHMFGASGGGGNAGCIGCVCVDGSKGRGITSPADGIPMGDNFDIDYVAHEVGHQLGANHTFSMSNEGTGQNKEVGSGITIMGYAGITGQDVAPHSIDIFHETSIQQIQNNLAGKACPVTTNITANNATPVVSPQGPYTIPISTPFALTGVATDANPGDALTYCWEQDDNANGTVTGNNSVAFPTKLVGPNWLSFPATATPTRLFPKLATILTGASVSGPLPGGDAIANTEALSSVGRTLNFRLTVRDNHPYSSSAPLAVGQTAFTDVAITVNAATGPFLITSQNTAISYDAGSSQTVTWSVNGTTGAPINCANVKISFSTDGGVTFPTVLAASTPNDGSEIISIPATLTTTGRIKVEAIGNIFFDINNANITITPPPFGFSFGSTTAATASCPAPASMNVTLPTISNGGFTNAITLSATAGVPAGTTISFGTNPVNPGSSSVVTLNNSNILAAGTYNITIQGAATGAPTITTTVTFTINAGTGPVITLQPADQAACSGTAASFSVTATGALSYQWESSTTCSGPWADIAGANSSTLNIASAVSPAVYRVRITGQCGQTTSACASLTINTAPSITTQPQSLNLCAGSSATFTVAASGSGLSYQWEISTDGGTVYNPIPGETSDTYTIGTTTTMMNNNRYRCVVSGTCPPAVTSSVAILSVSSSITITADPTASTICEGTNTSFTVTASGSGLSYQWEVSTNGGTSYSPVSNGGVYGGATSATLTITGATPGMNGNMYRCVVSNPPCNPGTSAAALLTVNTFPVITAQPQSATLCEGAANTFAVTATTGVGVLTYQWQVSTNGGTSYTNITGATNASLPLTLITAGADGYMYRVVVTAGCGSVTSNGATITVNTYPAITLASVPVVICQSDAPVTLNGTPAGGSFTGTGITGSTFTPSAAGVGAATITYTATNAGCTSVSTRVIQVNECAERHVTLDKYPAVVVYPNPNNGIFKIKINTDLYTRLAVRIYNSAGAMVKAEQFTGIGYGSILPVDMSQVAAGVYQLYLYNNENGETSKGTKIVVFK